MFLAHNSSFLSYVSGDFKIWPAWSPSVACANAAICSNTVCLCCCCSIEWPVHKLPRKTTANIFRSIMKLVKITPKSFRSTHTMCFLVCEDGWRLPVWVGKTNVCCDCQCIVHMLLLFWSYAPLNLGRKVRILDWHWLGELVGLAWVIPGSYGSWGDPSFSPPKPEVAAAGVKISRQDLSSICMHLCHSPSVVREESQCVT